MDSDLFKYITSMRSIVKNGISILAIQKDPQATEIRIPNSTWSGYGFSHSGPATSIKARIEEEQNLKV